MAAQKQRIKQEEDRVPISPSRVHPHDLLPPTRLHLPKVPPIVPQAGN